MIKSKRLFYLLPRLLAFVATLSAAAVMATSHETVTFFAVMRFEAKYSDTPSFKYFMVVNAIATVYGFIALFLPLETMVWSLVVVLDLVITMLLISSISASTAIAHVGKKGYSQAGWLPVCDQVTKYCDHVTGALAAGFIGLITYTILLFYSIHTTILHPLFTEKPR
ncbi:hypothetical protein Tsubulata_031699 [Turnera subulata]|uniref:CASP-like protein n=1 Tax=Turnera subulata TaxID=218843 RepID=A0A9Q0FEW8_9ROSI|nr:hypothetical protein Tsubulata_031699 [Turnera subulata]